MQNKTLLTVALGGMLAGPAAAAGTVSVQLIPDQEVYAIGDTITVQYIMDFTNDATLGGGTDIFFDPILLDFAAWTWDPAFSDQSGAGDNEATPADEQLSRDPDACVSFDEPPNCFSGNDPAALGGELNGLSWGNFDGLTGPYVVGTLTFIASDYGVVELMMAPNEDAPPSNPGPFYSATGSPQDVNFIGAQVEVLADQEDPDGDGVLNSSDNCTYVHNPDQCDTNGDGYGNLCDADLDNNGIVNSFDLTILRTNFGQTGGNDADLDCNGIVNSFDLTRLRSAFGTSPGPGCCAP